MSVRPKGEKRKQRWVAATDAEWTLICQAADAAGVPRSEFVVRSCLAGQVSAGSGRRHGGAGEAREWPRSERRVFYTGPEWGWCLRGDGRSDKRGSGDAGNRTGRTCLRVIETDFVPSGRMAPVSC